MSAQKVTAVTAHYAGEMVNGRREGEGTYLYPNLYFRYTGEWVGNIKHGHGVFTLGDGSSYEGEFVDGEMTGRGTKRWAGGATYVGEFRLGELCGHGTYLGSNGDRYEGEHVDNRRHGNGRLTRSDGTAYEGSFSQHKYQGDGVLRTPRGSLLRGNFEGGVLHGHAEAQHPTYEYVGEFRGGQRHGMGRLVRPGGVEYDGAWGDGVRLDSPVKWVVDTVLVGSEAVGVSPEGHISGVDPGQPLSLRLSGVREITVHPPRRSDEEKALLWHQRRESLERELKAKRKKAKEIAAMEQQLFQQWEAQLNEPTLVDQVTATETGRIAALTLWKVPVEKETTRKGKRGGHGHDRPGSGAGKKGAAATPSAVPAPDDTGSQSARSMHSAVSSEETCTTATGVVIPGGGYAPGVVVPRLPPNAEQVGFAGHLETPRVQATPRSEAGGPVGAPVGATGKVGATGAGAGGKGEEKKRKGAGRGKKSGGAGTGANASSPSAGKSGSGTTPSHPANASASVEISASLSDLDERSVASTEPPPILKHTVRSVASSVVFQDVFLSRRHEAGLYALKIEDETHPLDDEDGDVRLPPVVLYFTFTP